MENPRKQNDNMNRHSNDVVDDDSSISSGEDTSTVGSGNLSRDRSESGLMERLSESLVDNRGADLLIQRSDREDRLLQWLQALDVQVIGACRADERLRPFLKMNAVSGLADDGLLAHLSQHFEPSEVGILARCFFVPLVSIRVGKINKQGTLLCPTSARGSLELILLPTSDLRLSFNGDDGNVERLFTLCSVSHCPAIVVDEISADTSGRSFFVRVSESRVFYFWCSEKSKLLGNELLMKMKDIISKKPSIAELTGISKSRLDCFATQLRAYLVGTSIQETAAWSSGSSTTISDTITASAKSLRLRGKANSSYQGRLSPRPNSFKDAAPRSLPSIRNVTREKLRNRRDGHLSTRGTSEVTLPNNDDISSNSNETLCEEMEEVTDHYISEFGFLDSLEKLACPLTLNQSLLGPALTPSSFSPYYCWCPEVVSSSGNPIVPPDRMPSSIPESPLLPPLSSLLSSARPSMSSLPSVCTLGLPALLPDPLVRLPLPSSQQIPTFTPLMCDPIVHIPVIDVCTSGQGYLVSAGPSIAGMVPPLHPKLVSPLIPETDSVVKSARETLRLLINSSSQGTTQFINAFPSVLVSTEAEPNIFAAGSRGLYTGSKDVDAMADSYAAMGLGLGLGLASILECSSGEKDAMVLDHNHGKSGGDGELDVNKNDGEKN